MSSINQLRYNKTRQSHATQSIQKKTMLNSFDELYVRDNGIFLQWDFDTLRSEYNKDLHVSQGSIQFENGQIILGDDTILEYQMNQYFPTKNFAILIKYTDNTTNNGLIEIAFGSSWSLIIGYNSVIDSHIINYELKYTNGVKDLFPIIENFTTNELYNVQGENEICLVIDNDTYQEVSVFLNKSKISFSSFDHTLDVEFLKQENMSINNLRGGVKINQFIIHDIIPTEEENNFVVLSVAPMPSVLMWDFSNGNLSETTYDSLVWTIHSGSITHDATGIVNTSFNTILRLYNTNNLLYETLTNGEFLRDVKINIKLEAVNDPNNPIVFAFRGRDVVNNWWGPFAFQFYDQYTMSQMLTSAEVYPFLSHYNTAQFTREVWASNNKWSWSLESQQEPDGNNSDIWKFYLNDNIVSQGNTYAHVQPSEVGMYFPNNTGSYLEILLYHHNQRIEYISFEKINNVGT